MGFEPTTSALATQDSTVELHPQTEAAPTGLEPVTSLACMLHWMARCRAEVRSGVCFP